MKARVPREFIDFPKDTLVPKIFVKKIWRLGDNKTASESILMNFIFKTILAQLKLENKIRFMLVVFGARLELCSRIFGVISYLT